MAKIRIIPYGYKIEGGKTVIEPQEAESIRKIYRQYVSGLSYKAIAKGLTAEGIRYQSDKPTWNKNMISRILRNENYLGTDKYPAILETAEYRSAQQAMKPYTHTESQDIKTLKPLLACGVCGESIKRRLKTAGGERWYCPTDENHITLAVTDETLLQGISEMGKYLAENPQMAKQSTAIHNQISLETARMQSEIDRDLTDETVDYQAIQEKIINLAKQRYALCQDKGDDGAEIIAQLAELNGHPPTSKLLRTITKQIKVKHTQVIALVLKNGKIIEKGASPHE